MDNPPDPRPVFEADQVITFLDLHGIRAGYYYQYEVTRWYQFKRRIMLLLGIAVCNEMIHWLTHGKPKGGVQCKGGHTDGV